MDYIVLLHGLGRTSLSMKLLASRLSKQGYNTININYSSRKHKIEYLADYLKKQLQKNCQEKNKKINFVTHSMGGIIVRYFLANNKLKKLNRVIMLAPPNQGSELATIISKNKVARHIMGPALEQLKADPKSFINLIKDPNYEIGIITGKYDKKVSIKEAQLKNMKDFLVVPKFHSFIMNSKKVTSAITNFLQNGNF